MGFLSKLKRGGRVAAVFNIALSISAIGTLSAPLSAKADFVTGNELLEWCEHPDTTLCLGYLMGAVDAWLAEQRGSTGRWVCLSPDVTNKQVRLIVLEHFNEHPEDLHWPASFLVWNALVEVFPCRESAD